MREVRLQTNRICGGRRRHHLQLKEHFTKELESGNVAHFLTIRIPLVSVLTAMEIEGININLDFLKELSLLNGRY